MSDILPLTPGMFGSEFNHKSPRFGIHCGQMRSKNEFHNAGWYNKAGEKIGWGDLSRSDLDRIAAELQPGEVFIVLGEHDSFWNFVTHNPGILGSFCKTSDKEGNPGQDYAIEKARAIIVPGKVSRVRTWDDEEEGVISREQAAELVKGS